MNLQITEAFDFYKDFILDYSQLKSDVYAQYGFTTQGSVGSCDWEVFAAILVDDRAKPGHGADLLLHEVKSAVIGSAFEYQYHKNHGLEKLRADQQIDHLFISRSRDFENVEIRLIKSEQIAPEFERWLPDLHENYRDSNRQRFRRSIGYKFVEQNGILLMQVSNGKLIIH